MDILVVGGAGYIGSHMLRCLHRAGHRPVVFDNFSTGHHWAVERAFDGAPPEGAVFTGDILDPAALKKAFRARRFDAVIHFAALALVGESVAHPARYYENNVAGTLNLLKAMVEAGVERLVFSSSCAVYGQVEGCPIRDDLPHRPVNPYGATKSMAERMMADFAAAYGLCGAALRYFNAAGAHPDGDLGEDHTPESHLIPNVVAAALDPSRTLAIYGNDYPTPDGSCVRDYVHVQDLATAHLLALQFLEGEKAGVFEACNLGTGRGTSNLEIVKSVEKAVGKKLDYRFEPRRPGDPPTLYAEAGKAARLLGWQPAYTNIDDIVATAWAWHQGFALNPQMLRICP